MTAPERRVVSVIDQLRRLIAQDATNAVVGRRARLLIDEESRLGAYVHAVRLKVEPDHDSEAEDACGVYAVAEIAFVTSVGADMAGEIRTGGLWDIQQPTDAHLREVGREELEELGSMLAALGLPLPKEIDWSDIDAALGETTR